MSGWRPQKARIHMLPQVRLLQYRLHFLILTVVIVKQRDIGQLKKKAATDEEWEFILSHFLLQEQPGGEKARCLDNVHMEYSPEKSGNVQLIIRRDVQGIKVGETGRNVALQANLSSKLWARSS